MNSTSLRQDGAYTSLTPSERVPGQSIAPNRSDTGAELALLRRLANIRRTPGRSGRGLTGFRAGVGCFLRFAATVAGVVLLLWNIIWHIGHFVWMGRMVE